MNRSSLTCLLLLSLLASAHSVSATDDDDARQAAFYERLKLQKNTFDQFCFLSGPEIQGDTQMKAMAAQMLATDFSFLGRHNDALQTFPNRGSGPPRTDLPTTSEYHAVPAADWISSQAGNHRVVLVNEAHHAPQTRLLTLTLLETLRKQGYTHFAAETFALVDDPLAAGYPTLNTGYYTRDPVFAELVRHAKRMGYVLVPYEPASGPDQTQQARETGMAEILAKVLSTSPQTKLLVHAGYSHIGESRHGLPDSAKPMAMELARISGLALLTVDQTTTRSYETDDIDTIGRQLAHRFALTEPSVLIAREDGRAWSSTPGRFDASALLPSTSTALRPNWLELEGRRRATAVDFAPCIERLPCLVEARYATEGDDAIPADQFVMRDHRENDAPLYLAPGTYRLRLTGNDGIGIERGTLDIPAYKTTATTPTISK